ncbi:response regulator transcription factor [Embleya sp. NBC_00896]|uniref:response regulator transcription factor n=1 Tax=Embleya sp. NBC_00896 TaxID=2975961 RepID=UPI002F90FA68|nr:response regulator transcription factor [Embleya sp. NBC_00896]
MRVLVVEDEVPLAETVRQGLADAGFNVDVVHTGTDGLWAATEKAYDVIVLDIMLPGLNGYRVCERLRAAGVWTPVLMLTAKDGEYDQADAFDLGADDYLTKPFSFVVLTARLRALVRRGAPVRPVVLTVGDLSLDPARHRVERAGEEVRLTPREFSLLCFLMRRAGDVVTKTEILENVWDTHYDGPANVVEVYVGYLRRKIDQPFFHHSIQTVRGSGYRLVDDPA